MCGILGVIGSEGEERPKNWAAQECYKGLMVLQHRGQDAAGILSCDKNIGFRREKGPGLVVNVFDPDKLSNLEGEVALGHTRYATVGSDQEQDIQPMMTGFPFGMGMVHNGNLVNYHSLVKKLKKDCGLHFISSSDLEVLLYLWCRNIQKGLGDSSQNIGFEDVVRGAKGIFDTAVGGYALCGILAGVGLMGMRDPAGIRPLVLGRRKLPSGNGHDYCLSSESKALDFLDYDFVRDIRPGEVILIDREGAVHSRVLSQFPKSRPCMFEWVYFAGAESQMASKNVYTTRLRLGKYLAIKAKKMIENGEIAPEIVCPVPDTARTASIALAEELGLPYREGLIKNRYIQRSFILSSQQAREKAVECKLSPIRSEVEGRNILLVDDSLVRGTTGRQIVKLLKKYGAGDITLALTCPPLRYPCYYGIDFPSNSELLASNRTEEEIASWLGANRVIYMEKEHLVEAIGLDSLCTACLDNDYPTSVEEGAEFAHQRYQKR